MRLMAPHSLPETVIILPNPSMGNEENLQVKLVLGDAEDSTQYSYIKRTPNQKFIFDFYLSRSKAKELETFILTYYTKEMRLIDHNDVVWRVYNTNDLLELSRVAGEEFTEVRLTFEGVLA